MSSLWDAIHQKATKTIVAVIHCHKMTGLVELVSASEPRWTRANDGDAFAGPETGRFGLHPAHFKALKDDQGHGIQKG